MLHKRDIIRGVAKRWAETYAMNYDRWPDKKVIGEKLAALDPETATAQQVNEIIGNTSWTAMRCVECGQDHHATLVQIGDQPDYDAQWVDLCRGVPAECGSSTCRSSGEAMTAECTNWDFLVFPLTVFAVFAGVALMIKAGQ